METRFMQIDEVDEVVELLHNAFNKERQVNLIRQDVIAMFTPNQWIKPMYLVKQVHGEIVSVVGYSQGVIDFNNYGIFWVATKKAHEGKGYCTELINTVLHNISQECNDAVVQLSCKKKLKPFYQRFGFDFIDIREFDGAYLMRINLNTAKAA